MKQCDGIRMLMMVYGCICANVNVYESIYWYMNVKVVNESI